MPVAPHLEPADPAELALKYDRLAWRIAIKYRHRLAAGGDLDDLAQVCRVGVLKAARTFDRSRGVGFITYAWRCVAHEIERWLVLERRRGLTRLGDAAARLRGEYLDPVGVFNEAHAAAVVGAGGRGEPPTLAEIAVAPAPDDGPPPIDGRFWELAARGLSAKECAAVLARYRDGLTLEKAGERMGLTKERVRQLCVSAVEKIRAARSLDEFAG